MSEKFEGATTALITPLFDDGSINWRDLQNLVEFQVNSGINNLLSCGTTGQSPTLSWEEHSTITKTIVKINNNRIPIIAGTGSNNSEEAVRATYEAYLEGADATLHVTGYYNMPAQLGIIDYFSRVAKASPLPVIMYDVRGRGHPPIMPATRIYLAKNYPNVIGVKEASGERNKADWVETRRIARENGFDKHTFKIISGDDPATFSMMSDPEVEGVGVISVWSNILPNVYVSLAKALSEGNIEEGKKIDDSLKKLNSIVGISLSYQINIEDKEYQITNDSFRNPAAVQFAAYLLGMIESPRLRSPLVVLPEEGQKLVGKTFLELYESHPEYFKSLTEYFKPVPTIEDRLMRYR
ncbi:MAG: 4-hydroxy-tetrahydrodipicolinate synthase [Candidatus Aenigmarchaeota archaeon]|nr:4-hydroxy-tetrahydrodipicolinate synthase [Candidatus Aenigmarchaeota archaeon]